MQLIVYKSEVSGMMSYDSSYMAGVQRRWEEWRESAIVNWLKSHNVEIKMHKIPVPINTDKVMHVATVSIDGVELTEFMLRFGDQL